MVSSDSVDVCVCTFRRPSLEQTLRSLAAQEECRFRVIVADNDVEPSARPLVERRGRELGLDITYVHAPARNISVARNACLEASTAKLIAFIDDDECAEPHWLVRLVEALGQTQADVVFGPVRAIYGDNLPAWASRGDFHSARPVVRPQGISTGYTCNVLMKRAAIGEVRFDPALGRSGGEDTSFFHELHARGVQMAYAERAVVTEVVPPERARLGWLVKRSYRSGQTHGRTLLREGRRRLPAFAVAAAKAAFCAGQWLAALGSPVRSRRALVRGALHVGVMSKLLGRGDLELY